MSHVVTRTPEELAPEVQLIVNSIASLAQAKTPSEHDKAMLNYEDGATFDSAVMRVYGKRRLRAMTAPSKLILGGDFTPSVVRVRMLSTDKALISVDGAMIYKPLRTVFVPWTFFLPSAYPVNCTVDLTMNSTTDKVSSVNCTFHNLPSAPYLMRWVSGFTMGVGAATFEPVVLVGLNAVNYATAGVRSMTDAVLSYINPRISSLRSGLWSSESRKSL
jgi:hypothetical protein